MVKSQKVNIRCPYGGHFAEEPKGAVEALLVLSIHCERSQTKRNSFSLVCNTIEAFGLCLLLLFWYLASTRRRHGIRVYGILAARMPRRTMTERGLQTATIDF